APASPSSAASLANEDAAQDNDDGASAPSNNGVDAAAALEAVTNRNDVAWLCARIRHDGFDVLLLRCDDDVLYEERVDDRLFIAAREAAAPRLREFIRTSDCLSEFADDEDGAMPAGFALGRAGRLPARVLNGAAGVSQICVWGETSPSMACFWARLEYCVPNAQVRRRILKVNKVLQAERELRFDVYVVSTEAARILDLLRRNGRRRFDWHTRLHRPYHEREHPGDAAAAPAAGALKDLRLLAWNINGLRRKREDLASLLQTTVPHVAALQETLLRATDWRTRASKYNVLELGSNDAGNSGHPSGRLQHAPGPA
ncbi:Hypothetical Protein FCC1311_114522, partial [Hondaea fermentalgiana]